MTGGSSPGSQGGKEKSEEERNRGCLARGLRVNEGVAQAKEQHEVGTKNVGRGVRRVKAKNLKNVRHLHSVFDRSAEGRSDSEVYSAGVEPREGKGVTRARFGSEMVVASGIQDAIEYQEAKSSLLLSRSGYEAVEDKGMELALDSMTELCYRDRGGYKEVLGQDKSRLMSSGSESDREDLEGVRENQEEFSCEESRLSTSGTESKELDEMVDDRQKLVEVARRMKDPENGVVTRVRRHFLLVHECCFTATDAIDWLMKNLKVRREKAILIGKAIQREGLIVPALKLRKRVFEDEKDLLFRFTDDVSWGGTKALTEDRSRHEVQASITSVEEQKKYYDEFWGCFTKVGKCEKKRLSRKFSFLKALSSYAPKVLLKFICESGGVKAPYAKNFYASVLFADISGFTSLCEMVTKQGSRGVEILTAHLNEYFGEMIDLILAHGGDIVKFAGDALLAIFPTSNNRGLPYCTLLCAQCALAMQVKLNTNFFSKSRLKLHIGIGAGELCGIAVGDEEYQMEFLIDGDPISQVNACEAAAKSGEVYISSEAGNLIKEYIEVSYMKLGKKGYKKKTTDAGGRFSFSWPAECCLVRVLTPILLPEVVYPSYWSSFEKSVCAYIQPTVLSHLNSNSPDQFLAEFRDVSVIFVNLGIDCLKGNLDLLQECAMAMLKSAAYYEGTIRQFISDDKGYQMIAAFGLPPQSHEDDSCRAVKSALMFRNLIRGLGVEVSIGITTGKAFCGAVGSEERREYAIVGDIVNLSSRLMSKAVGSILCDSATYYASNFLIQFKALPPVSLKGRSAPIEVYSPHRESHGHTLVHVGLSSSRRSGFDRDVLRQGIFGRGEPLTALLAALDWLKGDGASEESSRFVYVEGDAGIGKTFFLSYFLSVIQERGVKCLTGSAFKIESAAPYFAWREAVWSTICSCDGEDTVVHPENVRNTIRRNAPEYMDYVSLFNVFLPFSIPETDALKGMSTESRAKKLERMLLKFIEISEVSLIILDNAQWLDSASWGFSLELVRSLKGILLVIGGRLSLEQSPPELEKLMATRGSLHLKLNRLDRGEIESLVKHVLKVERVPAALTSFIEDRGEGNPVISLELLDALIASGNLQMLNGECKLPVEFTRKLSIMGIPTTLRGLIIGKLDRLSPVHQVVLKVASVIGTVFEFDLLDEVLMSVFHLNVTTKDLEELKSLKFIYVHSEAPLTYAFEQTMVQEVVYDLMLFAQRRELHEKIAEWYELNQTEERSNYTLLAYHYRKAELIDKAILYYSKSGESAMSTYANHEAVVSFRNALELHAQSVAARTPGFSAYPAWHVLSWKRRLGQALYSLGNLHQSKEILEDALVSINEPVRVKLAQELLNRIKVKSSNFIYLTAGVGCIDSNLYTASLNSGRYTNDLEFFSNGHQKDDSKRAASYRMNISTTVSSGAIYSREHILILLTLSQVYYYNCDLRAMTYCNLKALKKARSMSFSEELCHSLGNAILNFGICQRHDLASAYIENSRIIQLWRKGSHEYQLILTQAIGMYYSGIQCWSKAENAYQKVIEVSHSIGNFRRFEESTLFLSFTYFLQGKIRQAQQLTTNSISSSKNRGDFQFQIMAYISQALNMLSLGQTNKAVSALNSIQKISSQHNNDLDLSCEINFSALKSISFLSKKDFESAYKTADHLMSLIEKAEPTAFFNFIGYTILPQVYSIILLELNKVDGMYKKETIGSSTLFPKLLKSLKHLKTFFKTFTFAEPRSLLWEGVAEFLINNSSGAIELWKRSLELACKYGMLYDQGMALYRIGSCTDVKDTKNVIERKLAAHDRALDIFTEIGAVYTELLLQ